MGASARTRVHARPDRQDHWHALRVAAGLALPGALLLAAGRPELLVYSVFGSFTGTYGRGESGWLRTRHQIQAGLLLCAGVALGVTLSWLHASAWMLVVVEVAFATAGSVIADALRLRPAGPFFFIFAMGGVPLVLRGSNFEGLTPEGDRLVLWARRILADRDALEHEVTALRSGLTGELRLGVVPGAATRVALMADALCAKHPLVRVRIESSLRSVEILDRIRRFELDAGVVYDDGLQTDGLELTRLYEERYVLVAGDGLLRDAHDPIDWSEALSLPMCLLHKGMRDRDRIDEAAAEHGLAVSPRLEADSVATLLALVGTGRWAAIVARTWFATAAPPAGTRTVELQAPTLGSPVALVRGAGEPASLLARALAQVVARPDQP